MSAMKKNEKDNSKKKVQENECWYNNADEKDRKLWNEPDDGGLYDAAHFEHGVANSIAKRQH